MKSKNKLLREILGTGRIENMQISVATEPRIVVKTPANTFILSAQTGRTFGGDATMLTRMRESLTHDLVAEAVEFTAVDRQTLHSESGKFKVLFRGYNTEEATGQVVAGKILSHIRATSDESSNIPRTAEALAGLESQATSRIIYNIPDSQPSTEVEGYDRKHTGRNAVVWFNTTDGSWFAKRTEAGKLTMGELAEVGMEGLTVADILDAALQAAPRVPLEH